MLNFYFSKIINIKSGILFGLSGLDKKGEHES